MPLAGSWFFGRNPSPIPQEPQVKYTATLLKKPAIETETTMTGTVKPYLILVVAEHPDLIFALRISSVEDAYPTKW